MSRMPNTDQSARSARRRAARAQGRKVGKILAQFHQRQQRYDLALSRHSARIARLSPARRDTLLERAKAREQESGDDRGAAAEEALD